MSIKYAWFNSKTDISRIIVNHAPTRARGGGAQVYMWFWDPIDYGEERRRSPPLLSLTPPLTRPAMRTVLTRPHSTDASVLTRPCRTDASRGGSRWFEGVAPLFDAVVLNEKGREAHWAARGIQVLAEPKTVAVTCCHGVAMTARPPPPPSLRLPLPVSLLYTHSMTTRHADMGREERGALS